MAKKPKSAEDWAEFNRANKALAKEMAQKGKTYLDLSDVEFKNTLASATQEQLTALLKQMKSTREFYKKVLQESYYEKHPEKKSTHRYIDARKKYESVNSKGKIVHSLITNS
jgi:hypothetical protein